MALFQASSLEDIASHFEKMAELAANRSGQTTTKKDAAKLNVEARTWERAAQMLRDTRMAA